MVGGGGWRLAGSRRRCARLAAFGRPAAAAGDAAGSRLLNGSCCHPERSEGPLVPFF